MELDRRLRELSDRMRGLFGRGDRLVGDDVRDGDGPVEEGAEEGGEDFDEDGAHGLLQNHLSLGVGSEGAMRVVFDASDAMGKDGDEGAGIVPPSFIDLSILRGTFILAPPSAL